MNSDVLINKYRPNVFDYVYGHKEIVASLQSTLEARTAHSFLFVGPSGLGKTTLARIVSTQVGVAFPEEVDAGKYTGKDDMTELTDGLRYRPLFGENKCIILNECQSLSKKAWDSLLMSIEEPPKWLYWCLTTTEGNKVPETIKSRCACYQLKSVSVDDLTDLLEAIRDAEGFQTPTDIVSLCARSANGSPRKAISNLAVCENARDRSDAATLLENAEESADAIELIRALVKGAGWSQIQPILERLKETNPESIRHVCRAYLTKAIIGSKDEKSAIRFFELLEHFAMPFYDKDQLSPIILAVGRILLAERG